MALIEFSIILEMEDEQFEEKEKLTELLNAMEDQAARLDYDIYSTDYREV